MVRTHFLHIRKTGGSALTAALAPIAAARGIVLHARHPHRTTLADIPDGERVFFIIRHPVARFVSGFNSRLRMGRPLFNRPWTTTEAAAFARFTTPNALAEALSSRDAAARNAACAAMEDIRHINAPLSQWLTSIDYVCERKAGIVWVGETETLGRDFARLKNTFGLPPALALPDDPVTSHRTPDNLSTALSEMGRANIEAHYAADIVLFKALRDEFNLSPDRGP